MGKLSRSVKKQLTVSRREVLFCKLKH